MARRSHSVHSLRGGLPNAQTHFPASCNHGLARKLCRVCSGRRTAWWSWWPRQWFLPTRTSEKRELLTEHALCPLAPPPQTAALATYQAQGAFPRLVCSQYDPHTCVSIPNILTTRSAGMHVDRSGSFVVFVLVFIVFTRRATSSSRWRSSLLAVVSGELATLRPFVRASPFLATQPIRSFAP